MLDLLAVSAASWALAKSWAFPWLAALLFFRARSDRWWAAPEETPNPDDATD